MVFGFALDQVVKMACIKIWFFECEVRVNSKGESKGQGALNPNAQNTPDFGGCGPP